MRPERTKLDGIDSLPWNRPPRVSSLEAIPLSGEMRLRGKRVKAISSGSVRRRRFFENPRHRAQDFRDGKWLRDDRAHAGFGDESFVQLDAPAGAKNDRQLRIEVTTVTSIRSCLSFFAPAGASSWTKDRQL